MTGETPIGRLALLLLAAAAGLGEALPLAVALQAEPATDAGRRAVAAYLASLARPDGGYGWAGQERSHLTPTFAVVGAYRALGSEPPRRERLIDFIRNTPPFRIKRLEREWFGPARSSGGSDHWTSLPGAGGIAGCQVTT